MRKLLQKVFNRIVIVGLLVLIQLAAIVIEILYFSNKGVYISAAMRLISVVVVFTIVYKNYNPAVKLAWIVPIMAFPLFGGFLYLALGHLFVPIRMRNNMKLANEHVIGSLSHETGALESLKEENHDVYSQCNYIAKYGPGPVYTNTDTRYFSCGEDYWEALLEDLESAKNFIFIEYFIIGLGQMWDSILEVLKRKAQEGVEVRVLYDDFGSALVLPNKYYEELSLIKGIECRSFNRINPFFNVILNNRDHRKIVSIDGRIGYSGGVNLADEYINRKERFGYWKDAGIRLEGDAVWSFTVLFLQMWNIVKHTDEDFSKFMGISDHREQTPDYGKGYVQPYGDSPLDDELVGENVYLNLINSAKHYLWIFTPYLIVDDVIMESLKLACKRGVDVKIVTPGIPDKKMVHYMTRCSYLPLIKAGAEIYEYTPGFIHSKCTLCDDQTAVIGTINYDYRSLYHHFECGVFMYNTSAIGDLKKDMMETFSVGQKIDEAMINGKHIHASIFGPFLHLFAPLL